MTDQRVTRLLASIEARASAYLARYPGSRDHRETIEIQRRYIAGHQPEGGAYGAPCQGDHDQPAPWPCQGVERLDDPGAYLD